MGSRLTGAEWAELVKEWGASGQSARVFAEAHGVSDASLRWWKSERGRRSKTSAARPPARPPAPIALARVVREGERAPSADDSGPAIALVIGTVRIVVERGFDPTLLRAVVHALEARS